MGVNSALGHVPALASTLRPHTLCTAPFHLVSPPDGLKRAGDDQHLTVPPALLGPRHSLLDLIDRKTRVNVGF